MLRLPGTKKMVGGLVFGPAAWMPDRIESTFSPAENGASDGGTDQGTGRAKGETPPQPPADVESLNLWLTAMTLGQTSADVPAVVEQVRGIIGKRPRLLVLNLLPAQPEYVLGAALSRLALVDVAAGLALLDKILKPEKTLVVMDRHDRVTRRLWCRRRSMGKRGTAGRVAVIPTLNRYPQGHPSVLLRTLAGARLPVGASPSSIGCLVVDPVSAWAMGRRLRTGQGFVDRPVQFFEQAGDTGQSRLLMGQVGETLVDFCRRHRLPSPVGTEQTPLQVIFNGMLAGESVDAQTARISGMTEAISVRRSVNRESASPCISCGWCVDVCPTGLTPVHLLELSQRVGAGRHSVEKPAGEPAFPCPSFIPQRRAVREARHCIACGLCSYVCPTRLPLTREIVQLRLRVTPAGRGGQA